MKTYRREVPWSIVEHCAVLWRSILKYCGDVLWSIVAKVM